jgi:enediyne biosynthesis protein E4
MLGRRRTVVRLVGVVVLVLFGLATRLPSSNAADAGQFHFTRYPLVSIPVDGYQDVRQVEPALSRIARWISGVGAGVAIGDIQGTGLDDDICLVDPRTNTVTVEPAPTSGKRFAPFVLNPAPLPYDRATMAPTGCLPGDFTEDGYTDLLVYYWGRSPILFLRKPGVPLGPNAFVRQELVPQVQRWYTSTIDSADLTGDGHDDLIIGNYFPDGSRILDARAKSDPALQMQGSMSHAENGGGDVVLLWKSSRGGAHPEVTYQEAPNAFPKADSVGWTLALGTYDLTGDMLPDVYIANDFGPNHLLYNESTPGRPHFVDDKGQGGFTIPRSDVLGRGSFKGMGIDFADMTGNGRTDMFVSNISVQFGLMEGNFAWVNDGSQAQDAKEMAQGIAPFTDEAESMGLARSGWGWDAKFGDFLNSGRPELIQATGFVTGTVNMWPLVAELATENDLFVRDPNSWFTFPKDGDLSGHEDPGFFVPGSNGVWSNIGSRVIGYIGDTRGVATADIDGNGRLDFAMATQYGQSYLFMNHSTGVGNYLELRLLLPPDAPGSGYTGPAGLDAVPGARGDTLRGDPATGAEATITLPDGTQQAAQVDGGNGMAGVRSPELHFGLGSVRDGTKLRAEIRWRNRSGQIEEHTFLLTPGRWSIVLGSDGS